MANWTGKKSKVVFSKPDEPSFLRKFKEKVGYKEDGGISEKFAEMPKLTDEDLQDGADELPQVVQLESGDISQEEYESILQRDGKTSDESLKDPESEVHNIGDKIIFRKSNSKIGVEKHLDLKTSTKKRKHEAGRLEDNIEESLKVKQKSVKSTSKKKTQLLSFAYDDNEED